MLILQADDGETTMATFNTETLAYDCSVTPAHMDTIRVCLIQDYRKWSEHAGPYGDYECQKIAAAALELGFDVAEFVRLNPRAA